MVDLIGPAQWAQYKSIINSGQETFNQQDITWLKSRGGLDRNGEDNLTETFTTIILKGLVEYNAFRKWATNFTSETGELDRQTEVLLLNMKYLRDNGYLNANNKLDYNPDTDRFISSGIKYKSRGDTVLSQAQDEPLLYMVVLEREETQT